MFLVCSLTQSSPSSWEYFTTLEYEWKIIRRRLPYRWTIWVRNDRRFTLVQSAVPRPCADARSVDLLFLAFHRSYEHYSFLCHFERYNPNKLSSGYFDLCLAPPLTLTSRNFEALVAFFNRGHTFICAQVPEKRMLITCYYYFSCSYACPRWPLPY